MRASRDENITHNIRPPMKLALTMEGGGRGSGANTADHINDQESINFFGHEAVAKLIFEELFKNLVVTIERKFGLYIIENSLSKIHF
jgi:hypothetical protein